MIDTIVVLDTETSGVDLDEGAALLEIAWVPLQLTDGRWSYGEPGAAMVRHAGPIPADARGVHHIGPEMVRDAPTRDEVVGELLRAETPETRYAAHVAEFDSKFLSDLRTPWLCTCQCAKHLYPDAPNHKNQTLRYYLEAEPPPHMLLEVYRDEEDMPQTRTLAPHRAAYDAACTATILLRMLETRAADELLQLTQTPVLMLTCPFKKYRGWKWSEVPHDYLQWITRTPDMMRDADLAHTVRHYLAR